MTRIRTTENLRLDILTKQLLGTEQDGAVEALLAANPGLAAQGPYVEEGTGLTVPARPDKPAVPAVQPWT